MEKDINDIIKQKVYKTINKNNKRKEIISLVIEMIIALGFTIISFFILTNTAKKFEQANKISKEGIQKIIKECETTGGSANLTYDKQGNVTNIECYYQNYDEMMKVIKGE